MRNPHVLSTTRHWHRSDRTFHFLRLFSVWTILSKLIPLCIKCKVLDISSLSAMKIPQAGCPCRRCFLLPKPCRKSDVMTSFGLIDQSTVFSIIMSDRFFRGILGFWSPKVWSRDSRKTAIQSGGGEAPTNRGWTGCEKITYFFKETKTNIVISLFITDTCSYRICPKLRDLKAFQVTFKNQLSSSSFESSMLHIWKQLVPFIPYF
jgi:hypothetical protein